MLLDSIEIKFNIIVISEIWLEEYNTNLLFIIIYIKLKIIMHDI